MKYRIRLTSIAVVLGSLCMQSAWPDEGGQATLMAGIPSYGICGVAIDRDDVRMHGRDERVPVESFYTGVEFYYEFLKRITTRKT